MTRHQFIKKSWKAFTPIDVIFPENKHMHEKKIECMVIGVDFEGELLHVIPFPDSDWNEVSFWVRSDYCHIPRPKLKIKR